MVYPSYIILCCVAVPSILKLSLLKVTATCAGESENPTAQLLIYSAFFTCTPSLLDYDIYN